MSTLLVNTLTATISRLKLQLGEKDNIIGKLREGQKASPVAISAAPVTMGVLPVYEGVDMACQVDMVGEALVDRAHIIEKQQAQLDTMLLADKKLAQMQQQQRQLSSSTLALLSKQQKVKRVTPHAVTYTTTKPREAVRKEMAMAHQRLKEELQTDMEEKLQTDMGEKLHTDTTRYINPHPTNPKPQQAPSIERQAKQEDPAWISRMLDVTNKLIKKYAVPRERRNLTKTKKRPSIVPKQFAAIWQLLLKPPPPLVHVPDPRPSVNWSRLNKNFLKNLPTPHFFPIQGVSQDPSFYTSTAKDYTGKTQLKFADAVELGGAPFGELRGVRTSHGIVCMPEGPVHGYVWSETDADWVIAANTG